MEGIPHHGPSVSYSSSSAAAHQIKQTNPVDWFPHEWCGDHPNSTIKHSEPPLGSSSHAQCSLIDGSADQRISTSTRSNNPPNPSGKATSQNQSRSKKSNNQLNKQSSILNGQGKSREEPPINEPPTAGRTLRQTTNGRPDGQSNIQINLRPTGAVGCWIKIQEPLRRTTEPTSENNRTQNKSQGRNPK